MRRVAMALTLLSLLVALALPTCAWTTYYNNYSNNLYGSVWSPPGSNMTFYNFSNGISGSSIYYPTTNSTYFNFSNGVYGNITTFPSTGTTFYNVYGP